MLLQTKGITLKVTNYSESSVVAQIYTEAGGLQSYMINGARRPKAKISLNMLQPFHLLALIVYQKETTNLQRIKEAQQSPALRNIPLNIVKTSIAIFLNEVLYKVLRHQQPDPILYKFIENSIIWLDQTDQGLANYPLIFLAKLTHYLGFKPEVSQRPYVDLMEGRFTHDLPGHVYTIQRPYSDYFREIMNCSYSACNEIKLKRADRSYLLQKLIDYYRLHTENFGEINSLYILEEVFGN